MIELNETTWMIIAGAVALILLILWALFGRGGSRAERSYRPDVLDQGAAPAQRNQALIDTAPAAQVIVPDPLANIAAAAPPVRVASPAPEIDPAPNLPDEAPQETPPEPQRGPQPAPVPDLPDQGPAEPSPPQQTPAAMHSAEPPVSPASDDLSRIKGLGPKLQSLLPAMGVTTFAQIASWTDADLSRIDAQLGPFAGRPARDKWVEQAQHLAAGDVAGFEAKFGKV